MCGIWALFGVTDEDILRHSLADCLKIAHRGPDATRIETVRDVPHSLVGFHRLEINDFNNGMQPMRLKAYPQITLLYNGEIYNAFSLQDHYEFKFESRCDAEIIIHLYERFGAEETAAMLDGVFAFVIVDTKKRQLHLGRDVFGVRPLFSFISGGILGLCSEVKGLLYPAKRVNAEIHPFPPGHVQSYELNSQGQASLLSQKRVISIGGTDPRNGMTLSSSVESNVRVLLKEAVRKRLMTGRRIGCLLSGGLDSSLITALVVQCIREDRNGYSYKGDPIQTFAIGMEGSPDVEHARLVAKHLNTEHHEISFTPEEGFQAVRDVIYSLESYDVSTIRASIGMYLVSKYIHKETDTVVLFSGEGADELCQGYLYFRSAPTPQEADAESRRLLQDIYLSSVLISERETAAHGLEVRVPFLDKAFTSYYLSLPPEDRQPREGVEKYFLRKCFSDTGTLPDAVLWRQKEGFSDGVASLEKPWFKYLQDFIKDKISDRMMSEASERFEGIVPTTKEAYYYRLVFEELFPGRHSLIPYYWMPKWSDTTDSSARTLTHYRFSNTSPDATRIETVRDVPHSLVGFHRLEINDFNNGMQPMRLKAYPQITLLYNGEIYNAFSLQDHYEFKFESRCDAEIIIHLYERFGAEETAAMLDGVFAFVIVDTKKRQLHLGRDVFGVRPLFSFISGGILGLCSEVKGLLYPAKRVNAEIHPFPPGHVQSYELNSQGQASLLSQKRVISIGGTDPRNGMTLSSSVESNVRVLLKEAVRKRLMTGRRIGCLLSGGLDSSLITALVVQCIREDRNGYSYKGDPIQTFAIGMEGSPDVEHARLVAKHLNTEHHEISFTPEEGFQAVRDVIYSLESYDVSTIRASIGMYLVSKYIHKETDTVVLFSGEGADELCQGYLYFRSAPTPQEADAESRRLLQDIYLSSVLISERETAAHGLEVRVPFLDKAFTSYYLSLPPEDRQPREGVEKYFLRKCFSDTGTLPDAVLWRQKEGFSDGVASLEKPWFKYLQDFIKDKISDRMMSEASERFEGIVPTTKEAYYYRLVFEELFPGRHSLIPYYWMPKWSDTTDSSARTLTHYRFSNT